MESKYSKLSIIVVRLAVALGVFLGFGQGGIEYQNAIKFYLWVATVFNAVTFFSGKGTLRDDAMERGGVWAKLLLWYTFILSVYTAAVGFMGYATLILVSGLLFLYNRLAKYHGVMDESVEPGVHGL